ncbi:TetR family transcriptional regulator C-terminal domain-containing protein [Nocardia sp. CA-120079]|uniref:TetR family transcriptional regulator C-terminal domain-containing protein n=1 Tax=Nocardia sp. CA-120079 TaxID=3239974 RepID=UPI003D96D8C8
MMQSNEQVVAEAEAAVPQGIDRVERAIRLLRAAVVRPSFVAELELWSAARTDATLRQVLRDEEKRARSDLYRVVAEAFGPELVTAARYPIVASLTVQFLRGLAISQVLQSEPDSADAIVAEWVGVVRALLSGSPLGDDGALNEEERTDDVGCGDL